MSTAGAGVRLSTAAKAKAVRRRAKRYVIPEKSAAKGV
jgi:hypothetical protein